MSKLIFYLLFNITWVQVSFSLTIDSKVKRLREILDTNKEGKPYIKLVDQADKPYLTAFVIEENMRVTENGVEIPIQGANNRLLTVHLPLTQGNEKQAFGGAYLMNRLDTAMTRTFVDGAWVKRKQSKGIDQVIITEGWPKTTVKDELRKNCMNISFHERAQMLYAAIKTLTAVHSKGFQHGRFNAASLEIDYVRTPLGPEGRVIRMLPAPHAVSLHDPTKAVIDVLTQPASIRGGWGREDSQGLCHASHAPGPLTEASKMLILKDYKSLAAFFRELTCGMKVQELIDKDLKNPKNHKETVYAFYNNLNILNSGLGTNPSLKLFPSIRERLRLTQELSAMIQSYARSEYSGENPLQRLQSNEAHSGRQVTAKELKNFFHSQI